MKTDRRTELREATFLILFRMDFYPKEEMEEQVKDYYLKAEKKKIEEIKKEQKNKGED